MRDVAELEQTTVPDQSHKALVNLRSPRNVCQPQFISRYQIVPLHTCHLIQHVHLVYKINNMYSISTYFKYVCNQNLSEVNNYFGSHLDLVNIQVQSSEKKLPKSADSDRLEAHIYDGGRPLV